MNIDELKSTIDSIVLDVWKLLKERAIRLDNEEIWEIEEIIIAHMAKNGMLNRR